MNHDYRTLMTERAQVLRLFAEVRDEPDSVLHHVHRNRLTEIDATLRDNFGPSFDVNFRQLVAAGRGNV